MAKHGKEYVICKCVLIKPIIVFIIEFDNARKLTQCCKPMLRTCLTLYSQVKIINMSVSSLQQEFQDPDEIDPQSEEFKALPPEVQYEVLTEMKEFRKQKRWKHSTEMPEVSELILGMRSFMYRKTSNLSRGLN